MNITYCLRGQKDYKNREFVMNSTNSNIFRKIADHIDYYYWNPQPGHPPRWLNIIVFLISLFLWFIVWAPIKVKTTEVLQLSPERGDEVYVRKNTGSKLASGKDSNGMYTDWMMLEINKKNYWCICKIGFCPHYKMKGVVSLEDNGKLKGIKEIIIINKHYCLVTKKNTYT